jgi:hypothetical protein
VVVYHYLPWLAAHFAIFNVLLVISAARIQCYLDTGAAVRTVHFGIAIRGAVAEREILVERLPVEVILVAVPCVPVHE